jgi:beta-glucosidase/6-phospho-beta-glucosidase/beta-galactosidase
VTLEGYAVEGGFDRSGGPMTCYAPVIALGRVPGPSATDNLWHDYEHVLNFVPDLGFEGVRLSVEWARVEPRQGQIDADALARYRDVLLHATSLGLAVSVVLVDAAWPSWLGQEAWLLPWVVPHVTAHARRMVATFDDVAPGVVVFAQPAALVSRGFLSNEAPPWRRGAHEEASFATTQIAEILSTLRDDPIVGPRLVPSSATYELSSGPEELSELRDSLDVDELYVRSLLRGTGPSAVDEGLLVQRGGEWHVGANADLLSALR